MLIRSHHVEMITVKSVSTKDEKTWPLAKVRVELRSCYQGRRKNDAFTFPTILPIWQSNILKKVWKVLFFFDCELKLDLIENLIRDNALTKIKLILN